MEHAIPGAGSEPERTVEIVVHISETLGDERRQDLVTALKNTHGIKTAEFCPLRYHLMLVRYDRDTHSSQDVLASVRSQHIHARLIGPV
ncbi:MAG: heavy-metal-associated domain-containing protein [Gammaproteobacteria bacterium]|jgi:hypothetical protein|nr:heavy-metal-associated domain-containing protein [Gammaproteobacteria bacterium]